MRMSRIKPTAIISTTATMTKKRRDPVVVADTMAMLRVKLTAIISITLMETRRKLIVVTNTMTMMEINPPDILSITAVMTDEITVRCCDQNNDKVVSY